MRVDAVAIAGLVVFAGCVPGCGCDGDAALDAGDDAGRDAGRDGGRDAGRDGGREAGRDAGAAGWVPLDGLPAACADVVIATNPSGAMPPLRFAPCADAAAGCRELVAEWPAFSMPSRRVFVRGFPGQAGHDGTHGYFVFTRPGSPTTEWLVGARDDGTVLAVVTYSYPDVGACLPLALASGEGTAVLAVSHAETSARVSTHLLRGAVGALPSHMAFVSGDVTPGGFVQYVLASSTRAAFTTSAEALYDVALDGAITRVTGNTAVGALIGDHLFYTPYGARYVIRVSDAAAAGVVLVDPVGAEAADLRTDGRDLVWEQLYGRQLDPLRFDRVELWTSPFTTTAADLAPRLVAPLAVRGLNPSLVMGFGRATIVEQSGQVAVFRLSDGHRAVVPLPSPLLRVSPLYLGPDEIAVSFVNGPGQPESLRIIRYDAFE